METQTQQVNITRIFNAPVQAVFNAWTKVSALEKWYAPPGCTIKYKTFDFSKNGKFHSCVIIPDGKKCWCIGSFLEIIPSQKIVFTMAVANEKGELISSLEAGMDTKWPAETIVTITFTPQGNKTIMTLEQTVSESLAKRTGAYPSWLLMFNLLDELLVHDKLND